MCLHSRTVKLISFSTSPYPQEYADLIKAFEIDTSETMQKLLNDL